MRDRGTQLVARVDSDATTTFASELPFPHREATLPVGETHHPEFLNEFLATLAHELRNPLAPIANAVRVLQLKGQPTHEGQWAVDVISRQTKQLTRLMDDLVDLARVTRNILELHVQRVDLLEAVRMAVETSRPLVEYRGVQLDVSLPENPIVVSGDLTRLAQIVSNLLNNAAKYTPRNGRISLTATEENGAAIVRVRDTGIGISAEALPHVFDMFTQIDRSRDQMYGGLGIGLNLARRLVEMHGGMVAASSDGPGKGSEFIVSIPGIRDRQSSSTQGKPSANGVPHLGMRILVVDDNRDAAESLAMLLGLMGNEVRTVHDGLKALEAAEAFRPHVALLDIGLPHLNGWETARALRQLPWSKDLVLIALTGWAQEADRRRSSEAGFDHHLVKPVDLGMLQRVLERHAEALEARETARTAASR